MDSIRLTSDGVAQRIDSRLYAITRELDRVKEDMKSYENSDGGAPTMIVRRRAEQLKQSIAGLAFRMENLHLRSSAVKKSL